MTGYRQCEHALEHGDSARRATRVNKGARKIMTEGPDELTQMLIWTALAGAFVLLLVGATCLVLSVGSPARSSETEAPAAACATVRRLCSSCRDPRDVAACRTSALATLQGVGVDDVHYVFADAATVPRMSVCSVESALRAAGNGSRVNVFVIRDVEDTAAEQSDTPQRSPVSLSMGLSALLAEYGTARLNVVRVELNECVECSPFRDVLPDLRLRPGLAEFAARLTVLWQFGGTVLDPSVVAVRDGIYRANGTAVEYGDRTVSVPAACNAFVYEVMLRCVASIQRWRGPFGPDDARDVWTATANRTGRAGQREQARPAPRWIVGPVAVDGPSYYAEANSDDDNSCRDFCPTVFAEMIADDG